MFNTKGQYINPTDVFNKKAALEMIKDPKTFEKKVRYLVKEHANKKW
jgi:ubiquitin-protein ligase